MDLSCEMGTMAAEMKQQAQIISDLLEALKRIEQAEGGYSRDPLQFAHNVIEDMQEIARAAIAKAEGKS